jgi:hypothetical protein
MDEAAKVIVFLLKPGDLLLKLPDFDEGRREGGDLFGRVAKGGLEFCDGLFELLGMSKDVWAGEEERQACSI